MAGVPSTTHLSSRTFSQGGEEGHASQRDCLRIVAAVGEAGVRELLDVLTRHDADRAALIGRLHRRADGEWLAELLIDLEEDEPARLSIVETLTRTLEQVGGGS